MKFGNWKGEAHVVETVEQAIAILMKKEITNELEPA